MQLKSGWWMYSSSPTGVVHITLTSVLQLRETGLSGGMIFTYVHIFVYVHTYIYIHIHAYIHILANIHIHAIHTCIHVYT
jgi:hypothetical protein